GSSWWASQRRSRCRSNGAGQEVLALARKDPCKRGCRPSMATDSAELAQIAAEAQGIATSAGQQPGTHHLLLATFTVPGPADALLRERGCDEDKVLQELAAAGAAPDEPLDSFGEAMDRAQQLAP